MGTMKNTTKKQKLPEDFRSLMWSYKFDKIDPDEDKKTIIVNTVNYGLWHQLQWLARYYGKSMLKKIIEDIPASEFRNYQALRLVSLILGIKKMKYATRSAKIKAMGGF